MLKGGVCLSLAENEEESVLINFNFVVLPVRNLWLGTD